MSRVEKFVDYRLTVTIDEPWMARDEASRLSIWHERASKVAKLIRSLSENVDNIKDVDVVRETMPICGHCGAEWTEGKDSPHNGGCCDEDAKAMPDDEAVSP